jgi:hypothetical protein
MIAKHPPQCELISPKSTRTDHARVRINVVTEITSVWLLLLWLFISFALRIERAVKLVIRSLIQRSIYDVGHIQLLILLLHSGLVRNLYRASAIKEALRIAEGRVCWQLRHFQFLMGDGWLEGMSSDLSRNLLWEQLRIIWEVSHVRLGNIRSEGVCLQLSPI